MQKKREAYIRNLVARFEKERAEGKSSYFDAEDFEDIIVWYLDAAQYEKAGEVLRRAEAIHPGNPYLTLRKAELYINLHEPDKALRLIADLPPDEDTLLVRASAMMDTGQEAQAIAIMQKLMRQATADRDLLCLDIADTLIARNRWDVALKMLKSIMPAYPHNKELFTKAVDCALALEDVAATQPFLEHLLDEDPYDIRAWAQLGECHIKAGRCDQAIEAYEFAMAASSGQPDYLLSILMGHAYAQKEEYETALEHYTAALPHLQTDAERNEVLGCMGEAHERLAHWEEALAFYEKALKAYPYDDQAWLGIGVCRLEQLDWTAAMNAFDRVLQINPDNEDVWTCIGDLYVDTNQFDEAVSAYTRALQLNPDQADVCQALGHLHFEANRLELALDYYIKAAGLDPELPNIYVYQALCLQFLGRDAESGQALKEALRHDPEAEKFYRSLFRGTGNDKGLF